MSAISLRLPASLHKKVRELAKKEGVSINQFVSTALAEKLSALLTAEYLEARGRRGERRRFDKVLSKAKDITPNQEDKIYAPTILLHRTPIHCVRGASSPSYADAQDWLSNLLEDSICYERLQTPLASLALATIASFNRLLPVNNELAF